MDIWQLIKKNKYLVFIFLIALLLRIVFIFSTPIKWWDETVYANLGYDLSKNPFDYSLRNKGWSDFIPSGDDKLYSWPKVGFRAPLLPYFLMLLYLFKMNFLVIFFVAIVGALSVILVFILGKILFNKRIGFYSAIFFTILPLHVFYSSKILTDVLFTFFVLLTSITFLKGYEENNKKYKILFGIFLALALLSRYTTLWVIPIFPLYLLIRNRSIKFLNDKYLWYSILTFFIILAPWFVYGIAEYKNPIGAFIHGFKASMYWGGFQPWYFFFNNWWGMFSIIGVIFVIALIYIFYKRELFKKEIYFLLIWFIFFLGIAIYMPHKEERFLLAISPNIALISGYFINKISKYKEFFLALVAIVTLFSLSFQFYINHDFSYTDTNDCFLEANKFLKQIDRNSLIITDESPIVYYYTKLNTHYYPNPWNLEDLQGLNQSIYFLFGDYFWALDKDEIQQYLDRNLTKVFECRKNSAFTYVYKG